MNVSRLCIYAFLSHKTRPHRLLHAPNGMLWAFLGRRTHFLVGSLSVIKINVIRGPTCHSNWEI